ncbi:septum formation initiator family protein [bacterium]|nr:septum formation initiator family protein [bacterium]MBU1636353.1 septum formation initiator family protein [bacterium]MBU1919271.1 septum formation initiator family protein [bacterium]
MRARTQDKKIRILFWVKLGLSSAAVLSFAGWLIFSEGGFKDSNKLSKERDAQVAQIALLQARKKKIEEYLEKLETSDEFAMETAARRYGLVSPTETIYRIKVEPEVKN